MATLRPDGADPHPNPPPARCARRLATLLLGTMLLQPGTGRAAELRLDTSLAGAAFDAILDGFRGGQRGSPWV